MWRPNKTAPKRKNELRSREVAALLGRSESWISRGGLNRLGIVPIREHITETGREYKFWDLAQIQDLARALSRIAAERDALHAELRARAALDSLGER